MASQSRAAQEQLAELEKASAPFGEQLIEAAKFVGVDLETVGRHTEENQGQKKEKKKGKAVVSHGREEWLLRWLLKKLQAPKDDAPRQSPSAWRLFCHLLQSIPLPVAARLLIERKFTTILRQTLEEAQKAVTESNNTKIGSERASSPAEESSKPSKKRKRSPELVTKSEGAGLLDLLDAIYTTLEFIARSTKAIAATSEEGRDAAFSSEYMKTTIKTSAQESATILGLWCSLSMELLKSRAEFVERSWLSPFVEIWDVRVTEGSDPTLFSRHALIPLMSLLRATKETSQYMEWTAQLEQLVARNAIIPAKTAKLDEPTSVLLATLANNPVISSTANAPVFFDIAIRSIVTHGTQRRRPQDDDWLQHVFATLRDAFLPNRTVQNSEALCAMLQSAKKYKADLNLTTLRSITSNFALPQDHDDWNLVAKLIALDANVFLIPDNDTDLMTELLTRITKACIQKDWADLADKVVLDVVVPLMKEFAKARDLSGFIRHWYAQLVEFERLRQEAMLFSMDVFGAWENEALQAELSKLLEPSLTIQQISQILDWLSIRTSENPNAVCVILEAISGSISREETVDAINTRIYHIMFDNEVSEKLDARCKWRSWRVLSHTFHWIMSPGLDELSALWGPGTGNRTKRFDALGNQVLSKGLLEMYGGNTVSLESLEMLRCVCASWNAADKGSKLANLSKHLLLNFLERLARELKIFPRDLVGDMGFARSICGGRQNTLYRDISWMMWAFVHIVFVEYPKVLTLFPELPENISKELLQNVFWISSANALKNNPIDWLHLNPDAFTSLWTFSLQNDCVLDCPALISVMMDLMLDVKSNAKNPLIDFHSVNDFAIRSLMKLDVELFSKENREHVLTSWRPLLAEDPKAAALEPAVLALKIKLMHRSVFYEGINFQHLTDMADALADVKIDTLRTSLGLFREIVRLTLSQIAENLDQSQRRTYIAGCLSEIQSKLAKAKEVKKSKRWSFSFIVLFDVVLTVTRSRLPVLDELDIIKTPDFEALCTEFKKSFLIQLKVSLDQEYDPTKTERRALLLLSTLDALTSLGVNASEVADVKDKAKTFVASSDNTTFDVGKRLESFLAVHEGEIIKKKFGNKLKGDLSTVSGRQAVFDKVQTATAGKKGKTKLKLLDSVFGEGLVGLTELERLLAARQVIVSCEDARRSDDEEDENKLDLSMAYSILCGQLWKANDIRQFCVISETLELMLRTKGRSMSQWNIDSTLGSITIICSRNGPSLRPQYSSAIYLHLCRLLQAVLTSHRLKLQGHFHLVVQVTQTLLRCLFIPLRHSTTKTTKFLAPPPWLSSSKYHLGAKHAAAFTRLVTLICDPSVSSVTRSQHNTLTSATDKAKRMAGQHMQFILTTYIKLQLEMKMLPEVREKMTPGLYAIFDTTGVEMRRMISESLDGSGRAVFGGLFRDYQRFGKWKGS